jgi:hypothetical protein
MGHDLVADDRPLAYHEIENAGRQARRLDRSHELDGGHRSRRRRNPCDRMAGGQSGSRILDRDVHRIVPRRDDRVDAPRLAESDNELGRVLRRQRLTLHLANEFRRELESRRRPWRPRRWPAKAACPAPGSASEQFARGSRRSKPRWRRTSQRTSTLTSWPTRRALARRPRLRREQSRGRSSGAMRSAAPWRGSRQARALEHRSSGHR